MSAREKLRGRRLLTIVGMKLARMRTTVNSLETLDSDMREQNLQILREMEEATVAKIPTPNTPASLQTFSDVSQAA